MKSGITFDVSASYLRSECYEGVTQLDLSAFFIPPVKFPWFVCSFFSLSL